MIELATIQAAAQVAGGRLITGIAAGLVLMTFTAMVLPAIRRSSTRFAVCFLTLLAVAVLPVASCFVSGHANVIPAAFSLARANSPILVRFQYAGRLLDISGQNRTRFLGAPRLHLGCLARRLRWKGSRLARAGHRG